MAKTKLKPFTPVEAKNTSDKVEIQRERFDLKQFRHVLKAELADVPNKAIMNCATNDPNLIDKVLRAHFNESSGHSIQRLQTEKAAKREHSNKRAITQAEATASFKG